MFYCSSTNFSIFFHISLFSENIGSVNHTLLYCLIALEGIQIGFPDPDMKFLEEMHPSLNYKTKLEVKSL